MKHWLKILVIVAFLFSTAGCWNNRDLTELAIVSGVGIDVADNKKIELTMQIIKPSVLKSGQEGGGSQEKAYMNVTVEGNTVFEAIRNVLAYIDRRAYFAHVQVMIIGEELADQGIGEVLDLFERDHETRRRAEIIIARGIKAKEVLDYDSELQDIPSVQINKTLKTSDNLSKASKINLFEMLKELSHEEHSVLVPVIQSSSSESSRLEDLKIEGMAVIKKDRLIGYISALETRGFMFAKNKVNSTIVVVEGVENPEKPLSIEVSRSEGKIKVKFEDHEPVLSIEVKAQGGIGEQHETTDLAKPEKLTVLEKKVEARIREEIDTTVKASQDELRTDIFGFIDKIEKNYYSEWKEIHQQWNSVYMNLDVEIKVDFQIRRTGLIEQPATTR